jgi:ABC-type polar amino acid transport system ATPase subunit
VEALLSGRFGWKPGRPLRDETRSELHRDVGMVFQFHNCSSTSRLQNASLAPVHVLGQIQHAAEHKSTQPARGNTG